MEIERNKTWEFVERSSKKSIDMKWVLKLKLGPIDKISKYKARLRAKGFLQNPHINFNEVYAFVARLETIKIVVSTATYKGWKIHQLDVNLEFLNGPLEEEVYARQPPGFEINGHKHKVFDGEGRLILRAPLANKKALRLRLTWLIINFYIRGFIYEQLRWVVCVVSLTRCVGHKERPWQKNAPSC